MLFTYLGRVPWPCQQHRGRAQETLWPYEAAHVPMYVLLLAQLHSGLVTSALASGTCLHIGLDHISSMCLVAQSCLTLCHRMDCSLPGCSVHEESPQEYWSGLPCPPPGDLPNPGTEPRCPAWWADSLPGNPISRIKYSNKGFYNVSELRSLTLIEILVFNNKYPG